MRILALGGVAGPVLLTAVTALCASARPGYSHVSRFISELGATGTAHAWLMNFAGFLPSGLLLAGFGVALAVALRREGLGAAPAAGVVAFGAGVATAGLLSCDPGCPQHGASLESMLHDRISVIAFVSAIVTSGWLGLRFRGLRGWHSLWLYSSLSSVAAFVLLALLVGSVEARQTTGLWQRLLLLVLFGWCAVVGVHVYRRHGTMEPSQ